MAETVVIAVLRCFGLVAILCGGLALLRAARDDDLGHPPWKWAGAAVGWLVAGAVAVVQPPVPWALPILGVTAAAMLALRLTMGREGRRG